MKRVVLIVAGLVLALLAAGPSFVTGSSTDKVPYPEVRRITKEQLREMLGKPDVVVIDARPMEQWKYTDQVIPGTTHEDPASVPDWAQKYAKNKTMVIYCA
jgi:predicted sulfurtransferase